MSKIDRTGSDYEHLFLCWGRGDNDAKLITFMNGASAADVSGQTFQMTVNTEKDPTDITNQVFTVEGVFVTDGVNGQVTFTPPANSLDAVVPGKAFYDIARTSPDKRTLWKSRVTFIQDIGKG